MRILLNIVKKLASLESRIVREVLVRLIDQAGAALFPIQQQQSCVADFRLFRKIRFGAKASLRCHSSTGLRIFLLARVFTPLQNVLFKKARASKQ